MKSNLVLTAIIIIVLASVSSLTGYFIIRNAGEGREYSVTRIIDGDTIEVENLGTVRLLGINAPEKDEYYFKEASDFLTNLIQDKDVKLKAIGEDKDKYNRLLRYVFLGDTFVNLELVKKGYATVYILNPDEEYYLEFKQAENAAKNGKLGLWSSSGITAAKCISIVAFGYDAVGSDNENLNGEYVTFQNNCKDAINMNGWTVKDAATHVYTFTDFGVEGYSTFTLYTGSGVDSANKIYWKNTKAVWNNDGDTLFLRDGEGNLVLSYSYP